MFIKEFICRKCKQTISMKERIKGRPEIKNACKCGIHNWDEII